MYSSQISPQPQTHSYSPPPTSQNDHNNVKSIAATVASSNLTPVELPINLHTNHEFALLPRIHTTVENDRLLAETGNNNKDYTINTYPPPLMLLLRQVAVPEVERHQAWYPMTRRTCLYNMIFLYRHLPSTFLS